MSQGKKECLGDRIRYKIHGYCDVVELALAIIVGLVLVYKGTCYFLTYIIEDITILSDTLDFQEFLKNVLILVVGIEFIKMLLKPDVKNVIDVLIFLVARQLILDHSSPAGMLLCVISIILLYGFLFFIRYLKLKDESFREAVDHPHRDHEAHPDCELHPDSKPEEGSDK